MLNRTTLITALSALTFSMLSACGGSTDESSEQDPAPIQEAKSSMQRDMTPQVADDKLAELVSGNTAFGFDLYQRFASSEEQEGKNIFYSSYSVSSALAMVYAGAKGSTAEQMAETLHYTLGQDDLHPAFNRLDLDLADRAASGGFQLSIANATWGQQDYHFESDYLDLLAVDYGAGIHLVDFIGNPGGSRAAINGWVSDQTQGKIPELMPPDTITPETRFVLTNAIYFKAEWEHKFDGHDTYESSFRKLDGSSVETLMMHQSREAHYYDTTDLDAVELPYQGGDLSMLVMVPSVEKFAEFESSLNAARLAAIASEMQDGPVELTLPRFKFETSYRLGQTLEDMGMTDAFGAADFSGITGAKDLSLSAVIHKAFVAVNEEGTEAAAATGAAMSGAAPDTVYISATSPFLFVIRDTKTGAILFTGRVMDPTAA